MNDLSEMLRHLDACAEAREWARDKTPREAWEQCPRGDWLLWIAARVGVDRTLVVRAAARCAETALPHAGPAEPEARAAIEAAHRWADEPTPEHARAAARAADAAARAADAARAAADAADAADAAALAASDATSDAADAAASAADAAYAASYATVFAATWFAASAARDARAARTAAQQRHAEIVREVIPYETVGQAYRRHLRGG